ncbi:MAG: V-type ATP synthase subunit D [Syntrophales bacterium]|jgi:V/A-type H+-transporting ATPase subunit D|nr:V-type ATP synthase subunit D [Syntrophales bacterium]MCK9528160.1 V-type ATP synthase subunit D [Syntrophales bacterium]MDX9921130.1 V-type ATP synthase subunit D [Syntrophales bacterium]
MPHLELPPTKSSLRKIKDELTFAYEGYDLLNQKREVLVIEIMKRVGEARRIEAELADVLGSFYGAYRLAAVDMGSDVLTLQSSSEKRSYYLRMESTRLMGLRLPKITIREKKLPVAHTVPQSTASYDEAKKKSIRALRILSEYAAIARVIILLSRELKKVQRRVNALEKIFIPQHEEAKVYITGRIEEMEREEVFVKKLIRQRHEEAGA